MIHLFTYGTLMHPLIWNRVVKGAYEFQVATIHDFERLKLKNRDYPGLIRRTGKSVKGIIYLNINQSDIHLLDYFEGSEYKRITLPTQVHTFKHPVKAYLYVGNNQNLLQEEWDYDLFLNNHFEKFVEGFDGWKNL